MKRQSELKVVKSGSYEYIYVYFKYKSGIIRINTGNQYIKSYMNKDLFYNSNMPEYQKLNNRTLRIIEKVDTYIFSMFQGTQPYISQKQCLNFIDSLHFDVDSKKMVAIERTKAPILTKNFFQYYDDFVDLKKVELKDSPSMKDYHSLKNALTDYQTEKKKKLTFDVINDLDFFNRFRNYLAASHKGGKSKGELNNNTCHKRFSSLKTFLKYVQEKEIFMFKPALFHYRIQKFNTDYVVLNRTEIQQLQNLKIENNNWQKIIDVFVCNCFMSLRFSDLQTFDKGRFIQDTDNDYYYQKRNEKTNKAIEIPILPSALTILKKYDFKLPVYTNQYFNSELKTILKHYNLFDEKIQKQILINGNIIVKYYLKRELISSHTARRSYITMAVNNNVSINAIQSSTGHTTLSSLAKYVKANRNKQQLKAID